MSIGDHIFENIPVYDRLHYTRISLFQMYCETYQADLRIGRPTFFRLVEILTTRGTIHVGLSTYYVEYRYCRQVAIDMLQRMCKLVAEDSSNSLIQIADVSCLKLLEKRFTKYAQRHVKNLSQIRAHDSRFILRVPTQQSSGHMNIGCAVCDEIFFIPNDLKHIVTSLSTANVSQTVREEISTMKPACDLLHFELMRIKSEENIRKTKSNSFTNVVLNLNQKLL